MKVQQKEAERKIWLYCATEMEICTGLAGIWIALTAGIFIGDEILKGEMEKRLSGKKQEEKVLKNKILLRLYHNYGAMLDLGQKRSRAVAITSVLLTLFLSVVFCSLWEREEAIPCIWGFPFYSAEHTVIPTTV